MNLYRIISLETFLDIVLNKRERYVRPVTWEDTFEGYLFSKFDNQEEKRKIVEYLYYDVCLKDCGKVITNIMHFDHSRKYVYGQCWSELGESDALWRIYSYGKHSIQIQTTDEYLNELIQQKNIRGTIRKIEYDIVSESDLVKKQMLQSVEEECAYTPFLHKRKAFEHEKEYRILIYDPQYDGITGFRTHASMNNVVNNIKQNVCDDNLVIDSIMKHTECIKLNNKTLNNYYINNIDLNKYIRKITINPLAEEWYVDLIKKVCLTHNLPLCEKSDLYKDI